MLFLCVLCPGVNCRMRIHAVVKCFPVQGSCCLFWRLPSYLSQSHLKCMWFSSIISWLSHYSPLSFMKNIEGWIPNSHHVVILHSRECLPQTWRDWCSPFGNWLSNDVRRAVAFWINNLLAGLQLYFASNMSLSLADSLSPSSFSFSQWMLCTSTSRGVQE